MKSLKSTSPPNLDTVIHKLLITWGTLIWSRLQSTHSNIAIKDTNARGYIYSLTLDWNWRLRLEELIDYMILNIVNYAIPKKQRDEARDHLIKTGSSEKLIFLEKEAKQLFVNLKKTWEGWEMLLYLLIQEVLGFPQLLAKMPLKTSWKVHYQWVDWIHVNYDTVNQKLELYWWESKMYSKITTAITDCLDSLKGYLLDPYWSSSTQTRDIQLVTSNISNSINDPKYEELLVQYFDKDNKNSNSIVYKGACFIWFDANIYPSSPNSGVSMIDIEESIQKQYEAWLKSLSTKIWINKIETFEIHIFLIPFPSVAEFRKYFLNQIK